MSVRSTNDLKLRGERTQDATETSLPRRDELPKVVFELFSSSFCGACDVTRGVIDQAMRVLPTVRVVEHNIADSIDLANQYDIGVTPTLIVRDAAGTEVMRAAGIPTVHHLIMAAERAMESSTGAQNNHKEINE